MTSAAASMRRARVRSRLSPFVLVAGIDKIYVRVFNTSTHNRQGPMTRAGDIELFVEEVGTGPPCLVMHGGLGIDHSSLRGLDPLADTLRLIYYDHRCHGRSDRPPVETI